VEEGGDSGEGAYLYHPIIYLLERCERSLPVGVSPGNMSRCGDPPPPASTYFFIFVTYITVYTSRGSGVRLIYSGRSSVAMHGQQSRPPPPPCIPFFFCEQSCGPTASPTSSSGSPPTSATKTTDGCPRKKRGPGEDKEVLPGKFFCFFEFV